MIIKALKHLDRPRDRNFETWLNRTEFYLEVIQCPEEAKTNALILLLNGDLFKATHYLGINAIVKFSVAKHKLKNYFPITEIKEKLIEILYLRLQEYGKTIESFARNIKLISHRAYPKVTDNQMLDSIMIKLFRSGIRDDCSRERVILQTLTPFTKAAQYARVSEAVVPMDRGHCPATIYFCECNELF